MSIKYLVQNVAFKQDGTVLRAIAPDMICGMLRAGGGEALMFKYAKELTPEISSVVIESAPPDQKPEGDGLEDL